MKYIILTFLLFASTSFALYYGIEKDIPYNNSKGIEVRSGDTPFPDGAIFPVPPSLINKNYIELKSVDGLIVERTENEKNFINLSSKYKKIVDGQWTEMTTEEKAFVDLPAKYKKTVDGVLVEMTAEEKAQVDKAEVDALQSIEDARQNNKSLMLKQIENLYITFLTNTWTTTLQNNNIISNNITINVTNTTYGQNMTYLIQLMLTNKPLYLDCITEFKAFEDGIQKLGGNLGDCIWH